MKHLHVIALTLMLGTAGLRAQWKTETYTLRGGWNGIYLHGDATYSTPDQLFQAHPEVLEIWRWNPNPDQIEFSASASEPDPSSSEWTVWKRDDPEEQVLSALIGQSSYLIRCSGTNADTYQIPITQQTRPPSATWLISGANFMGFPASGSASFTNYFASFPGVIASPYKVYKYIGGDLGPGNPMQVASFASEKVDPKAAYWFEAATVGDFTAPVEYELPGNSGLSYGRSLTLITIGLMNRTTSAITLNFSTESSESAPAGQTGISGSVPLYRRTYDTASASYVETPVEGGFSLSIPASGRMDLELGVDRSQLTGSPDSLFASFLRVKDSVGLSDVYLPVSAQLATPSGLWVGQIDVNEVDSTVAGSPGATTARSFPLRMVIHVDGSGTARLLSQAFVGTLGSEGHLKGICTHESSLLEATKGDALRLVSSTMPLDRVVIGTGSFAIGQTLSHQVTIPYDDPVNPFVHEYHPDHDNLDERMRPLGAGVESYNLTRQMNFSFTETPPDGNRISGWGTSVYGGNYTETIEGLNKSPLTVRGTFALRRVSEISDITLD